MIAMKIGVEMVKGNQGGMTLIELLVVMAIIGILVVVGVNMVGGVLAKHRLSTVADELSTRLRAAQMLSVVHNRPVSVIMVNTPGTTSSDSYYACIDSLGDGDCTDADDSYLNLDSGRTSTLSQSRKEFDKRIDMYDVEFSAATPLAVIFEPPSGLVSLITNSGGGLVNGVVCFRSEIGDTDDSWDDRYAYRRVTVNPVVGRTAIWRNVSGITGDPECRKTPEDDTGWQRVN